MSDSQTTVLSLRITPELASKFKVEAARRNMKLNRFFEELFLNYQEKDELGQADEKGKRKGNG